MPNKPTALPEWATTGTIVEPAAGKKELGWTVERPAYTFFNWLFNLIYQWIQFFAEPTGATADPLIEMANTGSGPCIKGTCTYAGGPPGAVGGPVFEGYGNPGIYGESLGYASNPYGVHGKGNALAPNDSAGVYGESSGHESAVLGDGATGGYGVKAVGKSTPGSGDKSSAHVGPQTSLPTWAAVGDLTVVSAKLYLCTVASTSSPTWVVVGTQT